MPRCKNHILLPNLLQYWIYFRYQFLTLIEDPNLLTTIPLLILYTQMSLLVRPLIICVLIRINRREPDNPTAHLSTGIDRSFIQSSDCVIQHNSSINLYRRELFRYSSCPCCSIPLMTFTDKSIHSCCLILLCQLDVGILSWYKIRSRVHMQIYCSLN